MAAACGISQSTISNLLSGKHGIGPKVLLAVIRIHPAEAMRAMGIAISDTGYPIGEAASSAIAELERDGHSSSVATWAVVTSCRFGGTTDGEVTSIVATARVVARIVEAIEQLSGARPTAPGQPPEPRR
jgi:hypothetical protein